MTESIPSYLWIDADDEGNLRIAQIKGHRNDVKFIRQDIADERVREARTKALAWAAETAGEFRSGMNDQTATRIREAIEKEIDFDALVDH